MKRKFTSFALILPLLCLTIIASGTGILSGGGKGNYQYTSIRGEEVTIYGLGLYQHMSAQVAIQGIAQDYVTLFVAVPLLLFSFFFSRRGSLRWRFVFTGALGYICVTYLFYLLMAMYNSFFLVYTSILGLSFFALAKTFFSFDLARLPSIFHSSVPVKFPGGFLMVNAVLIGLLWLGTVLPPLVNGTVYPPNLEHYTTLVVQGLDLGVLLPLSFVSGYMLLKKDTIGYLIAPPYLIFLSLLMIALVAKIIYSGIMGYNIVPVVYIIPVITLTAITCSILILLKIKE